MAQNSINSTPHKPLSQSHWAPRQAVEVLRKRFLRFETVLGVGFGELETDEGSLTGYAGLIVFVDETLKDEVEQVKKLAEAPVGGYRVMVRAPRTTFETYYNFLKRNDVPDSERFDCLPDSFWLDQSKVHRMVVRRTRSIDNVGPGDPADPATAVFGEIFVIEDDGTLVADPDTPDETVDYQAIFVKFRQQYGDHYDFAYIHHDVASGLNPGGGVSPTIFNDISGINHYKGDNVNERAGWNTTRLQSYQAVRSFQMRRMLHETAHRWLAYANHQEGGASSTNLHEDLITSNPGQGVFHWGNWYDDDNSCMDYDYFDWIDAPGGYQQDTLSAGASSTDEFGYTPVDLYLMGLMESAEVAGFRYLENPQDPDGDGTFTAMQHNLAITNIINEHGARNPDAASSQRVFHQAYILLTRDIANVGDLTTGVVQEFDQWRSDFEQRFREATLGRAIIDTRLLHSNYSSLYIRDNAADNGTGTTTGVTWNSPDIWVRQTDDTSTNHQDTDRSHDNYLRARVWNSSGANYDDVTVRFYIGNHADNLPGTDFEYPEDWRLDRFLGEDTISVPAGGNAIARITWQMDDIPPAAGWHPCILVEVLPMELTPSTLHRRTQNKKLAQKNITIVGSPSDPEDGNEFRFTLGRPRKAQREYILFVDRVADIPGLRIELSPELEGVELLSSLSIVSRLQDAVLEPIEKLRSVPNADSKEASGGRIFIPAGCSIGYSVGQDCWTTLRFVSDTVIELGTGLKQTSSQLLPRQKGTNIYKTLPSWYRTAVRIPTNNQASQRGFQIVRVNISIDTSINPAPDGKVLLRFMEYHPEGDLVGGVDYAMNLEGS